MVLNKFIFGKDQLNEGSKIGVSGTLDTSKVYGPRVRSDSVEMLMLENKRC